jgi:hypothetical protein
MHRSGAFINMRMPGRECPGRAGPHACHKTPAAAFKIVRTLALPMRVAGKKPGV